MGLQDLNDDVVLELSRYLTNRTRLSLAYTCRTTFRTSENWAFWYPRHWPEGDAILPAFFSKFLLWTEYQGSDYRVACLRQTAFRINWHSSHPQVKRMTRLGQMPQDLVPGTALMIKTKTDKHGTQLRIIDTLSGKEATVAYDKTFFSGQPKFLSSPKVGPGELLVVTSVPGQGNERRKGRFYRLRVGTKTVKSGAEKLEIIKMGTEPTTLPLSWWHAMDGRYICSSDNSLRNYHKHLLLYDTYTNSFWEWEVKGDRTILSVLLSNEWFMVVTKDQKIYLSAIHLPSFRAVYPPTTTPPSREYSLPPGVCISDISELAGIESEWCSIKMTPAAPSHFQGQLDTYLEREQDTFAIVVQIGSTFRVSRFHLSLPGHQEGDLPDGPSNFLGCFHSCRPDEECSQFLGCRAAKHTGSFSEDNYAASTYTRIDVSPFSGVRTKGLALSSGGDMVLEWLRNGSDTIVRNRIVGIDGTSDDCHDLAVDMTGRKETPKSLKGPRVVWGIREKLMFHHMSGESGYVMVFPATKLWREPVVCWF